jgi:hypothetical protein
MKPTRREVEDLVRRHPWPSPSAELRTRIVRPEPATGASRLHKAPAATGFAPPPPRWKPSFGVLLVVSLIFTFGGCTGADVWAGRSVEAEVARLEARYGSLDQVTMLVPPVPPEDNRARVARAAAALTVPPTKSDWQSLFRLRDSAPVPADLRAFVEANSAAVRLAADIRTPGQSNWEVDYQKMGDSPPWTEVRHLSDAIWVTARLDIEAGRADAAAAKHSSGLALAASITQEPELVSQLIRIATLTRQISGVQRLLTDAEPSRPALDELARWLTENRAPDQMRSALLGALKQTHAIVARMEEGDVDLTTARYLYPETWPALPESWYGPIVRAARPMVRLAHARYLRQMGELLAVEEGPRPRPAWPERMLPRRWELVNRLVDKFASGIERCIETEDDSRSEIGAAEVAVALRRYRLDHGVYPDDVSVLVPRYLTELPADPYTGRPPVYSRQGAGFTLRAGRPAPATWFVLEWNVPR